MRWGIKYPHFIFPHSRFWSLKNIYTKKIFLHEDPFSCFNDAIKCPSHQTWTVVTVCGLYLSWTGIFSSYSTFPPRYANERKIISYASWFAEWTPNSYSHSTLRNRTAGLPTLTTRVTGGQRGEWGGQSGAEKAEQASSLVGLWWRSRDEKQDVGHKDLEAKEEQESLFDFQVSLLSREMSHMEFRLAN